MQVWVLQKSTWAEAWSKLFVYTLYTYSIHFKFLKGGGKHEVQGTGSDFRHAPNLKILYKSMHKNLFCAIYTNIIHMQHILV